MLVRLTQGDRMAGWQDGILRWQDGAAANAFSFLGTGKQPIQKQED